MNKGQILVLVIVILMIFSSIGLTTPDFAWKIYETEKFIVFYPNGYQYQAKQTLYYLEKYKAEVDEITGASADMKIYVVIQDKGLISNGYANPVFNKINIYTNNPMTDSILAGYESWQRQVNIHEYTHLAQITNSKGAAASLTTVFGNSLAPNLHVPNWILEGITVYTESKISSYEGRLNHGYFDSIIASKAVSGQLPTVSQANYLHKHFPMGQWYLYGGSFFEYLADSYGEDKFADFFNEHGSYYWSSFFLVGDILPAFGIDKAAKKVYRKTFPELFEEWHAYEKNKYKNWEVNGKRIISNQYGQIKKLTSANDKFYYWEEKITTPYAFYYNSWLNLVEYDLNTKQKRVIDYSLMPSNASIQKIGDKIYYAVKDLKKGFSNINYNGSGATSVLYSYNLKTNARTEIFRDDFRDFALLADDKIIYAKQNKDKFGSEIWKYNNEEKEKLGVVPELISEMKVWQDKVVVVSKENLGAYGVKFLNIRDGITLDTIIDTNYLETGISINRNKLIFNANYDGRQSVYQYDLQAKDLFKLVNNGFNGVINQGDLYFRSSFASGTGIYQIELEPRACQIPPKDKSKDEIKLSELELEVTKSNNGFTRSLRQLFKPGVRLVPTFLAGEDTLGMNSYSLDYSPYGGLDFYFNSNLLLPMTLGYIKENNNDRKTFLSIKLPIYSAGHRMKKTLSLNYYTDFNDDLFPGLKLKLKHPSYNASAYLQSDINNNGLNGELSYVYLMDNSSLFIKSSYFNDFKKDFYLGGFKFEDLVKGHYFNAKYNHKLIEIRKGSWNPNLFVGDIYGSIFVDYIRNNDLDVLKKVYSTELSFETGMANFVNLAPKIGVSISDNNLQKYLKLSVGF